MRILSVKNYQSNNRQNNNFGMLKIVDANTPEKMGEAIYMIGKTKGGYKPFKISDALNPKYKPNAGKNEGGFYLGDLLDTKKLEIYKEQGKNILILDEELGAKIWKNPIAETFDSVFSNPIEVTMTQIRRLYLNFKKSEIQVLRDQQTQIKARKDAIKAFGIG